MADLRIIEIRDDTIRLGQLLKLADFIDNGSEAKDLLARGVVLVNGEVETRRGRQLVSGDTVSLHGETVGIGSRGV
jgi:ribosome-associated protein